MNERFKIRKEAHIDEQRKIGRVLVAWIDLHDNDLNFLGALRQIAVDLSKGKFGDGK